MASSNEFGMPVTNSPPNPRPNGLAAIGGAWLVKSEAQAAARGLANGPQLAHPSSTPTFTSANQARIYMMAYGFQNDFTNYAAAAVRSYPSTLRMLCSRGQNNWIGRVDGDCHWEVSITFDANGVSIGVDASQTEHSHALDLSVKPSQRLLSLGLSGSRTLSTKRHAMGAEGRPTYYDENSSEDSDAESASESEAELDDSNSESNASSEEENVASRTGKPRTSAAQSSGVPRDVRVKILAQELVDSGAPLSSILECRGVNAEAAEVNVIASALANGFSLVQSHFYPKAFDMRCARQRTGQCKYKVYVKYNDLGRIWKVVRTMNEHNHESVIQRVGGDGDGVGGGVAAAKKRSREEELVVGPGSNSNPRVVALKGSNAAGLMLPPPKRSSRAVNAVASGSGSSGIVATQYSTGSSSQYRLPPSSTTPATAPRLPAPLPAAARPWPVELARLIAITNTVLLDLSHVFAAIFIEAGVVNRYEFSKLLWTFSSENMKDERMLWFIERLLEERNGIALSRLQVIQFRSGAKRLFARIVAKTAKK